MERRMNTRDVCWDNACVWVVASILGTAVVAVAVALPLALPEPHPATLTRATRDACLLGESWDREMGACAPRFRAPLAFEGDIMNTTGTTACSPSFYNMMCGRWMQQHTNENRAFTYAAHRTHSRIVQLMQTEGPLRDVYQSCMGRESPAARREATMQYEHAVQRYAEAVFTHADLPRVLGRMARAGLTTPLRLSVERHPTKPHMLPLLEYDNLPEDLLNEQALYRLMDRVRPTTHMNMQEEQHLLQGAIEVGKGLRDMQTRSLEQAPSYIDYVTHRLDHDLIRWETLPQHWEVRTHPNSEAPVRGWEVWLQQLGGSQLRFADNQTVWVPDQEYVENLLGRGLKQFSIPAWRSWIKASILWNEHELEPTLPDNTYMHRWHVSSRVGLPRAPPRVPRDVTDEQRCVRVTEALVPGLLARTYLDTYMADRESDVKQVRDMVHGLQQSLQDAIRASTWLGEADRGVLVGKLNRTLVRVAEPNGVWRAEPFASALSPDRFEHNAALVRAYRVQRQLELWHAAAREPPAWDREAMARFLSPLTSINAYYSGQSNSITILAGIMQHPFYHRDYGVVSKYAILGSVVGHELSHALDPHGLHWDLDGSYAVNGILSEAGMRAFHQRAQAVVREYGPAPAGCRAPEVTYGNATLGEDLADLTGISAAFESLLRAHPELPLGDRQHFFMVLAQAFCESYDQAHRCDAVLNDVHAVAEFRIDRTMRNMRRFWETFGCHQGHEMWRNESAAVYTQ